MDIQLINFLIIGLGYGMLHAFDPDHVAAVVGVSATEKTPGWKVALNWSLGHGGVILVVAALVLLFGFSIPHTLSHYAESLVAYMLIAVGALGVYRISKIWKDSVQSKQKNQSHSHWVGMLHGMAGSAPLLTIPALTQSSGAVVSVMYILLFCTGVSLAMMGLGWSVGRGVVRVRQFSFQLSYILQLMFAVFALLLGLYLLFM